MKSAPTRSRTHGVKPSASSATTPSAKKSDEAISPYATAASDGVSRTRWSPGSFLATQARKVQPQHPGEDQERADHEPDAAGDTESDRPDHDRDPEPNHQQRQDAWQH